MLMLCALVINEPVFGGPIHDATTNGDVDTVKRLLAQNPNLISSRDEKYGQSPLHVAAFNGNKAIVELLLGKGADVNAKANNGATPLHLAAVRGSVEVATLLLESGAQINATDNDGWTPLHSASVSKKEEMIALLVQHGGKDLTGNGPQGPSVGQGPAGDPALRGAQVFQAATAGDLATVKALILETPKFVNSKDSDGNSLLHVAAANGNKELTDLLLEDGADVNAVALSLTPLIVAVRHQHADIAEALLAHGARVNAASSDGRTALHFAVAARQANLVELLLANYAYVDALSSSGTPLQVASEMGFADIAELLLDKGADVNAKGKDGFTPLHFAAAYGHADVAQLLIAGKADLRAKDSQGRTPADLAAEYKHSEVADLLSHAGASVSSSPSASASSAPVFDFSSIDKIFILPVRDNRQGRKVGTKLDSVRNDAKKVLERKHYIAETTESFSPDGRWFLRLTLEGLGMDKTVPSAIVSADLCDAQAKAPSTFCAGHGNVVWSSKAEGRFQWAQPIVQPGGGAGLQQDSAAALTNLLMMASGAVWGDAEKAALENLMYEFPNRPKKKK